MSDDVLADCSNEAKEIFHHFWILCPMVDDGSEDCSDPLPSFGQSFASPRLWASLSVCGPGSIISTIGISRGGCGDLWHLIRFGLLEDGGER